MAGLESSFQNICFVASWAGMVWDLLKDHEAVGLHWESQHIQHCPIMFHSSATNQMSFDRISGTFLLELVEW